MIQVGFKRFRKIAHLLLVLAGAGILYQLAARFPAYWDVTQNQLNSLEPGSVAALALLDGPLDITVYAPEQDARYGDIRKLITDFVSLYQRYKPDIKLTFVDPVKEPDAARKAAISSNGEMVVEYAGRREHLATLNEQALSSALLRLAHAREQLLVYLSGHGERRLDGQANHDLGEFGSRLQQLGYRINSLNLALVQEVPDNIALLVLTHPQTTMLPGEVKKLQRYVERGGNLLWLIDAEPLRGLEPLAEKLGVRILPGTIIDPTAQEMGVPADWALSAGYPPHPITRDFDSITVFPRAVALDVEAKAGWEKHLLLESAQRGWASKRSPDQRFDERHDLPGPFELAITLQRRINDHEQRLVVVGNGAFLANIYVGNGGNLDLGINMVNWLANEEQLIILPPRAARDDKVLLSKREITILSVSFLVAIPLMLAGIGFYCWRRRHA